MYLYILLTSILINNFSKSGHFGHVSLLVGVYMCFYWGDYQYFRSFLKFFLIYYHLRVNKEYIYYVGC